MSEKVKYEIVLQDGFTPKMIKAEKAADDFADNAVHDFNRVGRSAKKAATDVGSIENRVGSLGKSMMKKVGGLAAGFFAIDGLRRFGQAAMDTSAKYQRMQAVLENTFGNRGKAQQAFTNITAFASRTPFQVDELTDSFVKLTNQGFSPTMSQMTNLGDLASSTGKGFDMLTEAIIDAQTGEFERLKEFGIRASKEGDKVTFMFKGQAKTVNFTGKAIREYMLSLGKLQGVEGAMAKISKTTGGQISNLKDSWDQLLKVIGDRGKGVFSAAISGMSGMVSKAKDMIRVPLARTLEDERQKVNALAMELSNSLTPYERRKTILAELREINGDIVKGLDAEKISLGQLASNMEEYNRQAIHRIAIEKQKDVLGELNKEAAAAETLQWEAQRKMGAEFGAIQDKIRIDPKMSRADKNYQINALSDQTIRESIGRFIEKNYEGGSSSTMKVMQSLEKGGYDSRFFKDNLAGIKDAMTTLYASRRAEDASKEIALKFQKGISHMEKMFGLFSPSSQEGTGTEPGGTATGGDGGTGGTGGGIKSGIDSISGDVRAAKNITINLDSLIGENNNFFDNAKDADVSSFKDKLKMALQSVLNDVNYAL